MTTVQSSSGALVLCDISNAQSTYVTDCTDTSLWNDRFVTALSIRLAMNMCSSLVDSEAASGKMQTLQQMYKESLPVGVYDEEGWIAGEGDASRLVVYNMALRLVGARMVSSIWEDMPEAVQCGVYWDRARKACLRDYPYRFSVRRVVLDSRAVPSAYSGEWQYCYSSPQDMLKILSVNKLGDGETRYPFLVGYVDGNSVILSNQQDAHATYIADVTDVSQWDEKFTAAMSARLAVMVCGALLKGQDGNAKAEELAKLYAASIPLDQTWEEGGWTASPDATKLNICNIALGHIGASMITSLTDNVPESIQCGLNWDRARRSTLKDFNYRFSVRRVELSSITVPNIYSSQWSYCYRFPSEALKILSVHNADIEVRQPFSVEYPESGAVVLCNNSNAQATCIVDVIDTSLWDERFVNAMSYKLASLICHALLKEDDAQKSEQKIDELSKRYLASLPTEPWEEGGWSVSSDKTMLSIFNMALGYIGSKSVSSINENVPEAVQCNLYWDRARRGALRDYPYRFAQRRFKLILRTLPDEYSGEWRYCYSMPAEALKVTRVHKGDEGQHFEHYTVANDANGTFILCNMSPAFATCTVDVEDMNRWDELFFDVMARKLAFYIAPSLQKDKSASWMRDLDVFYAEAIPHGEGQSGSEGRDSKLAMDTWLAARCS